ncbi:hypothetical protein QBC46DRAFT_457365 [Diplogelasinospora grovesii]|uniref:U6 snRNA phosphodiesterase n=1 Tax=Diplogelasinospora grovesii TaxID=303347 RepID=A0AAN6NCN3_9PEZI|nr:hypothetical protein QBC46DRAFT_457365 [Diplogelasinospora grovesii]
MGLVDYSSDDSDSGSSSQSGKKSGQREGGEPPCKKPRTEPNHISDLPPLPTAFHDLYASTVRTTTVDDPTLHQGRTRQIPHVSGNWPSHVYIEWHPSETTQSRLAALLERLEAHLPLNPKSGSGDRINTFLTSDLGVPQPLHISLSRPIVFATSVKDDFLSTLVSSIKGSGLAEFELQCTGVEWHRTEESGRSFLVLRVATARSEPNITTSRETDHTVTGVDDGNINPELTTLLQRCNSVVKQYGQPELYKWRTSAVGNAFHISIAWSFAVPTDEIKQSTADMFNKEFKDEICSSTKIHVDGVKVKIGNVITSIPLKQQRPGGGSRRKSSTKGLGGSALFGHIMKTA